jgi:hypothetical protein
MAKQCFKLANTSKVLTAAALGFGLVTFSPPTLAFEEIALKSDFPGAEIVAPYVPVPPLNLGLPDELRILPTVAMPSDFATSDFTRHDDESWLQFNLRRLDDIPLGPYGADSFFDHTSEVGYEIAAAVAAVSYMGATNWNWGNSGFRFQSEGWFGKNTGSSGIDKLGHAYTTYMFSEYFTQRIAHSFDDPTNAAITGALIGMGIQTYVEVFDGFSGDHGFSYEDMIANATGATFSVLRSSFPEVANKLDYRLLYVPSGKTDGFHPFTDYSGQKYVLALKLAGFEAFEDTPLRFLELHGGYYVKGISAAEKRARVPRDRELYVGIGINFAEVLRALPGSDTSLSRAGQTFTGYVQLPYTSLRSN